MTGLSLFGDEPAPAPAPAPPPAADAIGPGIAQTQSLYRKYRPQTFEADDLVGQEHVVQTLRNAIALGRIAHAYLFCGPRGTGKTTTARLLAKAVNCLDPDPRRRPCNACASCLAINSGAATDVIEIDAASNRGIDDIRDLRERVKYAPTQLRNKFYIIDEAHQITGPAANAFLKTLEEPPAHTKFVLATTDPEELLPTIVSRCQRFDFRRIGLAPAVARLRTVAAAEGLTVEDEALHVVARHATGSLRDALGLLDQLAVYREGEGGEGDQEVITAAAVRALLGVSRNDRVETLVGALADRDANAALGAVNAAVEAGEDVRQLNRQLVAYLRVLLHERAGGSPDADERARALAARFELLELAELARRFGEIDYRIRHAPFAQLPLEVALVEGVLRGTRPAPATAEPPAASAAPSPPTPPRPARVADDAAAWDAPPPYEEAAPARPPGPSLRDRVRGGGNPSGGGAVPAARNEPASDRRDEPAARPPAPPAPPATARVTAAPANGASEPGAGAAGLDLERLVDLWPRIRADVKAVNRRIEALLSSIDPLSVQGSRVTLAAAYPFHRDRLNQDEVRTLVETTIGRLVGTPVGVTCVLRGEAVPSPAPSPAAQGAPPAAPAAPAPAAPNGTIAQIGEPDPAAYAANGAGERRADGTPPAPPPGLSPEEEDAQRLTAAKNIFDAEEI